MMMGPTSSVSSAAQDQRHIALGGAKQISYVSLLHFPAKRSDLSYFGRGQQFLEGFDEAGVDRMLLVSSVVGPFEVGGEVVSLVSVDVIDEGESNRVWNERESDKAMDETCCSFAFSEQGDLHVAEFMKGRLEKPSIASLRPVPCFSHSVDASNSSNVADFVEAFEAWDNSPLFFNHEATSIQLFGVADYSYTQSVVQ